MSRHALEPGRKILVNYIDETEWHERLLLRVGSPAAALRVAGTTTSAQSCLWWVLTPGGDVYPEVVETPDVAGVLVCDDHGRPPRQAKKTTLKDVYLHQFATDEAGGIALAFARALKEADKVEDEVHEESEAEERRGPVVPTVPVNPRFGPRPRNDPDDVDLPGGDVWVVIGSVHGEGLGEEMDLTGFTCVRGGDYLLARKGD